jgi:hypothetical protein
LTVRNAPHWQRQAQNQNEWMEKDIPSKYNWSEFDQSTLYAHMEISQ